MKKMAKKAQQMQAQSAKVRSLNNSSTVLMPNMKHIVEGGTTLGNTINNSTVTL